MSLEFDPAPAPYAAAPDGQRLVLRSARLFDGTGAATRSGMSIAIDGARITQVAPDDEIDPTLLARSEVVPLAGRCVIPGLVDSHQHLATPPNRALAEALLRRQVYGGVTAIRDMADDLRQLGDLTRATLVGELAGPDIGYAALMAGPSFFDDPRTWQVSQGVTPGTVPWMQAITGETELPIAVALARGTHAAAVKIYADLPPALVSAITVEAHRQGMRVWAHAAVFPARPSDVITAGVDVVSHVTMLCYETADDAAVTYKGKARIDPATASADDPAIDRLCEQLIAHGTVLDATASLYSRDLDTEADPDRREWGKAITELSAALTARAHEAGVPVSAGTDYETDLSDPWPSLHQELRFLVDRCGMTPTAVIESATRVGAQSAGTIRDTGTVESGKLANLVVLTEDPTERIESLSTVEFALKRGRRFARAEFNAESGGER